MHSSSTAALKRCVCSGSTMLCEDGGETERIRSRWHRRPIQVRGIPVGRVNRVWLLGLHVEDR